MAEAYRFAVLIPFVAVALFYGLCRLAGWGIWFVTARKWRV